MDTKAGTPAGMLFNEAYPALDLLRSVAIIIVMLVHFSRRAYVMPSGSWLGHFTSWGWNGVGLFFVLSGFLIGGRIIEEVERGTFSFKRFYIKRFWRIFPPYYFSLLVVSVLFFAGYKDINVTYLSAVTTDTTGLFLTDLVYHIFYLQDYLSLHSFQGGLYFSLAIEEQFYILIPFVLFLLIRYKRGWFAAIISLLILTGIFIRFTSYNPDITGVWEWNLKIRFPFHMRFDSLLVGVFTAWLFIRYHKAMRSISALPRGILFIAPAVALGACIVYGNDSNSYFNTCWQFTLVNAGFAALILLMVTGSFSGGYILAFFRLSFGHIAKLSYTMYLYHLVLLFPSAKLFLWLFPGGSTYPQNFFMFFGLYFFSVVLMSNIIYRLIDAPAMRHRAKILSRMDGTRPIS